ncbi:MAG: ATP-dependent Clp protease adaptor ClpS [Flavobacteriales bacterium]|nr:ATP-dependent Clp protease adaptor ClpS [Flavobacteriales bacterium]MCB9447499.1 ATP-dependent Clp protease adaptor ClpS [Flavobacteriales bacterium]
MAQRTETLEDVGLLEETLTGPRLVVFNDDVNTFDWVIESLVEVCNHDPVQAEQCAILIHHKGQATVKEGEKRKLKPMCEALVDRGIDAVLEQS